VNGLSVILSEINTRLIYPLDSIVSNVDLKRDLNKEAKWSHHASHNRPVIALSTSHFVMPLDKIFENWIGR
jgi:hypothetical protein